MTSPVFDFKSIRLKVERLEQKTEFEEKNPKVEPNKVVWSPEWGYGVAAPFCAKTNLQNIVGDLKTKRSLLERLHGAVVNS